LFELYPFVTKLSLDELIEYYQRTKEKYTSNPARISYGHHIFPEELTAEHIADEFGVSLSTVLRRLKQLENDNYLVSRRANVVGKKGKRLVFFLREDAAESQLSSPQQPNLPPIKYIPRELIYLKYSRTWEIKENFDALATLDLTVKNISSKELEEVALPKIIFDTFDTPNLFDTLVSIEIDGEMMPYTADSMRLYKKSRLGMIDETMKQYSSKYVSEIVYVIPMREPMKAGDVARIKLVTIIPCAFKYMFEGEFVSCVTHEYTLTKSIEVIAPLGHTIHTLERIEDMKFNKSIRITDMESGMRNSDLEKKTETPKVRNRKISWIIENPIIGYNYALIFIVTKNKAA